MNLTRKIGPLPAWLYLVFAGVAAAVFLTRSRVANAGQKSSGSASSTDDGASLGLDTGSSSGDTASDASGTSPLDLAALLGIGSPLQQLLANVYGGGSQAPGTGNAEVQGQNGGPTSAVASNPDNGLTMLTNVSSLGVSTIAAGSFAAPSATTGLGPGAVSEGGNPATVSTSIGSPVAGSGSGSVPAAALGHGAVLTG